MKDSTFAERMALAVRQSGLPSLQSIADAAGTSKGQVSQWQTEGKVQLENVKADVVERICEVLKIRPRWLLYGEPPRECEKLPSSNRDVQHAGSSQLMRLDPDTLRRANEFCVIKFASVNRDDVDFAMDKHAEVFALAYEWIGNQSDKSALDSLLRALEDAVQGGDLHGRPEQPDSKVRRRSRRAK